MTDDPLPHIAAELSEFSERLGVLAQQVRDAQTARPSPQSTGPAWNAQEAPRTEPASHHAPQPWPGPAESSPPSRKPRPSLTERLGRPGFGSRTLAWLGGGVTLAGVVLLLVLAIQRGWIGPVPRALAGAALGAALITIGIRLRRSPSGRTGAFALAATGFAVGYVDTVAATALLGLLPVWAGLVLGLVIALAGMVLAVHWDNQWLAVFVLAGVALCAPILTGGFTVLLLAFVLVLFAATAPMHLSRPWTGALLVSGSPPLAYASIAQVITAGGSVTLAVLALACAATAVLLSVMAVLNHPAFPAYGTLLAAAPVPVMCTAFVAGDNLAASLLGLLALLMSGLWVFGARLRLPRNVVTIAGGAAVVLVFQSTVVVTSGEIRAFAVLGQASLLAVLAAAVRTRGTLRAACAYGLAGLWLTLAGALPFDLVFDPWLASWMGDTVLVTGMLAALLLGVTAACLAAAAIRVLDDVRQRRAVLAVTGVVTLYATAGVVVCPALLISPDSTGFFVGHALVTVSWTVAALVLLLRGAHRRGPRVLGIVLIGSALAKLVLFDLSSLDGLARVAAFLGAGLVLLAAGVRYARPS